MKKSKNKFNCMCDLGKKIIYNNFFPFILLFFLIFILHNFVGLKTADDLAYSQYLNDKNLLDYIANRYVTWSSRVIIESVLICVTNLNVIIWRLIDSLLYTFIAYALSRLVNKGNAIKINYICCFLLLLYPLYDMSSAGWGATTLNYLWVISLGLLSFLPLINIEDKKCTKVIVYIISFLGLVYASNQEQMCAILLCFNVLYLINTKINKNKISKYNLLCIIISLFSMISILTCPGNLVRTTSETLKWFPQFKDYGIIQKLYFGIVPTINILIQNKIVLFVSSLVLSYAGYCYSKNKFIKVFSIINIIFISLLTILQSVTLDLFPVFSNVFEIFNYQGIPELANKISYVPILMSLYIILSYIILIYCIFGRKKLLPLFIFLAGFASRLIIGFSPTVFASGNRTAIFWLLSLLFVTLFVIYKLYTNKKYSTKSEHLFLSILIVLAVFNYLYIFSVI